MEYVLKEDWQLEQLDERREHSPEELFTYLEDKLETGELTLDEVQQYIADLFTH